jgi:CBS domain-containing protein
MVTLREIMSDNVVTVSPDMSLKEVADVFVSEHITGAPVVSAERLVGVISTTDLLELEPFEIRARPESGEEVDWDDWTPVDAAGESEPTSFYFTELWARVGPDALEQFRTSDAAEAALLDERTVSDVMTRGVHGLAPDADVKDAAAYMLEHGIHRVLVLEDGSLVGMVSMTDVVRAVAERGLGA